MEVAVLAFKDIFYLRKYALLVMIQQQEVLGAKVVIIVMKALFARSATHLML